MPAAPHLYVIPTPIGNLRDITLRALDVLATVNVLLCEDTRRTRKLLTHYQIKSPRLVRFDQHKEYAVQKKLLNWMSEGQCLGLVSDAGMPGISDAGYSLIRAMWEKGLRSICLPGATAFLPALICSGFPSTPFYFEGFLPHKQGRRLARLEALCTKKQTYVLYESPHRLLSTLTQLKTLLGDKQKVSISGEISKIHEQTFLDTLPSLIHHFKAHPPRGEYVLVYHPHLL